MDCNATEIHPWSLRIHSEQPGILSVIDEYNSGRSTVALNNYNFRETLISNQFLMTLHSAKSLKENLLGRVYEPDSVLGAGDAAVSETS